MPDPSITDAASDELAAQVQGRVHRAPTGASPSAGEAPLVLEAMSSADVARGVRFAASRGATVEVSGRSGDGSGPTAATSRLQIDLRRLTAVRVEPTTRLLHVQAAVEWGTVDRLTQAHGLATTGALSPGERVVATTLAGGNGHLARRHGLTADNLVGADVVTGDARVVRATPELHADLFWALRGGGGVGVVTSLSFLLHQVGPAVATVRALYDGTVAPEVISGWAELMRAAPEGVSTRLVILRTPVDADVAGRLRPGSTAVAIVGMFAGPAREGAPQLAPFADLAAPVRATTSVQPYTHFQGRLAPPGRAWHDHRAGVVERLDDAMVGPLMAAADALPDDGTVVRVDPLGGAIERLATDATAFAHRRAAAEVVVAPGGAPTASSHPRPDPAVLAAIADAFGPTTATPHQRRLAAVRREWDGNHLFHRPDRTAMTPTFPGGPA